jgi:predicted histidine transporter YuiF (NhaC family)
MEFWQILTPIIAIGTTLGFAVTIFLAYRNKTDKDVLRTSNEDLRALNLDNKLTIDNLKLANIALTKRVQSLEDEKKLPLDDLTRLVVSNHTQQLKVLRDIAKALNNKKGI